MQVGKQSLHLSDSLRGRARVRTDQDWTQHCGQEAVYRRWRRHRQHGVIVAQHHWLRWGVELIRGVERHVCRGGGREEVEVCRRGRWHRKALSRITSTSPPLAWPTRPGLPGKGHKSRLKIKGLKEDWGSCSLLRLFLNLGMGKTIHAKYQHRRGIPFRHTIATLRSFHHKETKSF